MRDKITIHGYGYSDIGQNRSSNEDYINMNKYLYVLADGIGGHNAGEIASKLAVVSIMKFLGGIDNSKLIPLSDENKIQQKIYNAIMKTNETVYQKSLENIELNGMGTTIVFALFQKPQTIHIANVGDSRAYLLRNNELEIITEDHSVTANMVRDGTISKVEAETHPYRHHLSRSIGTSNHTEAFTTFFSIIPGDKILLCSDGLWDVLSNEDLTQILQKNNTSKKICKELITKANELKSMDNISCIVITVSNNN